jgi:MFS superfamily sulfate permease-like transporter
MTAIDATGLQALEKLADVVHESGRGLILCGAREQPRLLMHQAEFEEHVGVGNICESITDALERARVLCPLVDQYTQWSANWGRRMTDITPANAETTSR